MFICKIFSWNLVLKKLSCISVCSKMEHVFLSSSAEVDKVAAPMNIAQPVMELGFAELSAGPIWLCSGIKGAGSQPSHGGDMGKCRKGDRAPQTPSQSSTEDAEPEG